jgi:hypothetical protein
MPRAYADCDAPLPDLVRARTHHPVVTLVLAIDLKVTTATLKAWRRGQRRPGPTNERALHERCRQGALRYVVDDSNAGTSSH